MDQFPLRFKVTNRSVVFKFVECDEQSAAADFMRIVRQEFVSQSPSMPMTLFTFRMFSFLATARLSRNMSSTWTPQAT